MVDVPCVYRIYSNRFERIDSTGRGITYLPHRFSEIGDVTKTSNVGKKTSMI